MAELRDAILASDEIDNAEDGARDAQEQHKKALRILKESQENKTQTTRSITD